MEASVSVTLPQMVDLALGNPEVGAVNFNVLHSLLHVLIQQVRLQECCVEFYGVNGDRIQNLVATTPPPNTLILTEYVVTATTGGGEPRHSSVVEEQVKVIEPRKDSTAEPDPAPEEVQPLAAAGSQVSLTAAAAAPPEKKKTYSKVVMVEPNADAPTQPRMTVIVPQKRFLMLEGNVFQIQEQLKGLLDMPKNLDIIRELRDTEAQESKPTPLSDVLQMVKVTKRIDATETGLAKIASMVEDLAREYKNPLQTPSGHPIGLGGGPRVEELEKRVETLEAGKAQSDASQEKEEKVNVIITKFDGVANEVTALREKVDAVEADMNALISKAYKGKDVEDIKKKAKKEEENQKTSADQRLQDLETRMAVCVERVSSLDGAYSGQLVELQDNMTEMENELGHIMERVNAVMPQSDANPDTRYGELLRQVNKLQEDIDDMSKFAENVLKKQDERQMHIESLVEAIEVLKITKTDREDMEEMLAEKADTQHMNRKVSHEQFDAACDDLAKGLERATTKLQDQEHLWQCALDELQANVGNKLDRGEFDPLKEFVSTKIKLLQERMRALLAIREEQKAAGAKSRVLKNLNCISCDKQVIMTKINDFVTVPAQEALPGTRSMRPYLTYELDAIRKQQKALPQTRNMNNLQKVLKTPIAKSPKSPRPGLDHLCNRYCGGSHTTTTPQQRVARSGHFLTQWGPEALPVREGHIMGKDGQMYKAREDLMTPRSAVPTEPEPAPAPPADEATTTKSSLDRPRSILKGSNLQVGPTPQDKQEPVTDKKASATAVPKEPSVISAGKQSRSAAAVVEPKKSKDSAGAAVEPKKSKDSGTPAVEARKSKDSGTAAVEPKKSKDSGTGAEPRKSKDSGGGAVEAKKSKESAGGAVEPKKSKESATAVVEPAEKPASHMSLAPASAHAIEPIPEEAEEETPVQDNTE